MTLWMRIALVAIAAATGLRAADGQKIRVACVGDSITFGYGVENREANAYPAVLNKLLGDAFEVRNFGVSGATLLKEGDKPYWTLDAFKQVAKFAPHFVIIKLGTNDTKPQNWKHSRSFRKDYNSLIQHFEDLETKPRVWVCSPVPVYQDRWGINEKTVVEEVIPKVRQIARRRKLGLIDLHSALKNAAIHFPDGVHPNAEGAKILATAVFNEVKTDLIYATPSVESKPNFVICIADDMAWNDAGAYGHPKIRTPNIDRLAKDGMRFDRAFLSCSSCSPSRSSILTGRYPHSTGAKELHQPIPGTQVLFVEKLRENGYYAASAGKWHLGKASEGKFDKIYKGGGASGCGNWVRSIEERPKDRPFFLWLAALDPHRSYAEDAIDRPHVASDAVVPPYLPDAEATRKDFALYYDEIARMDGFIGKVLAKLEQQGVADNTFVLFLSDNGRPFPRCKTTVYDSGIKTPFIVRWPACKVAAGSTSGSIVSSIDIAPTLLELAGVSKLPTLQGESFAPILKNPKHETRKFAFAEHNWHDYSAHKRVARSRDYAYIQNSYPQFPGTPPADAVRSPTYRTMLRLKDEGGLTPDQYDCFFTPRPLEELYDLRKDPHQLRNLVNRDEHSAALGRHRAILAEWSMVTRDRIDQPIRPDGFDRKTGERITSRN